MPVNKVNMTITYNATILTSHRNFCHNISAGVNPVYITGLTMTYTDRPDRQESLYSQFKWNPESYSLFDLQVDSVYS